MKNKILMILTREPYPVDTGRKSIISQTIEFLKDEYEIALLIFSKNELNNKIYKDYALNNVERLLFPSKIETLKNILLYKKKSLQERLFYSNKSQNIINNKLTNFKPNIVYADMIRTAQYVENVKKRNIKKIVDIDDLLSIRYSRFLKNKEKSIFGTFQNLIPFFLRKVAENILKEKILKKEIELISKREVEMTKSFDCCFLVSIIEVEYLSKITNTNNIYCNTQAIQQKSNVYKTPNDNNFIFIGNMNNPQNIASLTMLINKILPTFNFDYKFYIVGKYNQRVIDLIKNNNNIKILGFVDNLEDILSKMKLALMPIAFGTGIKTKILDCMSYGIPVITNTVGNEGLLTQHKKNIILCDDISQYTKTIKKILKDEVLLKNIGIEGQKYIRKYHNFEKLKINFLDILREVLK